MSPPSLSYYCNLVSSVLAASMEALKSMRNSGEKQGSAIYWKPRSKEVGVAVCCVAVIVVSFFAVSSSSSFHGFFVPSQIRTFFDKHENETDHLQYLEQMLDKAAMPNKTVIITTLNAAWAENNTMIDMFLESFRHGEGTQRLLQHLIIVCVDQKALDRCLAIHPYCLKIKTGGVDFSGEQALLSHDYIKLIWTRIRFLETVLEMGYSFIFTDTDILWFRDPFPRLQAETNADIQIACDRYNGRPWDVRNRPNAGFIYVRANERTVRFYKYWYTERRRGQTMADQEVLNAIKVEKTFRSMGLKLRFLETQFFGGFCAIKSTDMMKAYTMHATCCKGLAAKLVDLRRILDGWKQWQQRGSGSLEKPSMAIRHEEVGKRNGIAKPVWVDNDPHFKVPRVCPRSMRRSGHIG